jgi:hypothetical protein
MSNTTPHDLSSILTPRRNRERSSSTEYACYWHFLAQLPSLEIESIPGNGARNALLIFLSAITKIY